MDNIVFIGRVAEHVSRSAVTKAAQVASNLVVSPSNGGTAGEASEPTAPLTSPEAGKPREESEAGWGDAASPDVDLLDVALDNRDEVISQDEFDKMVPRLDRKVLPDRGDTDAARAIWKEPRRFSVRLRSFVLENLGSDPYSSVFLLVTIGGTLVEVRVRDPYTKATAPKTAGYPGETFCTSCVDLPGLQSTELPFEKLSEWRGSYLHLEKENFTLELWQNQGTSLNTLLAVHQEPLRSIVDTSVAKLITLENRRDVYRKSKEAFRITFQLEFQEIYDYELNFCKMKLLPPHEDQMNEATQAADGKSPDALEPYASRVLLDSLFRSSSRPSDQHDNDGSGTNIGLFVAEEPGLSQEDMAHVFEGYEGDPKVRILIKAGGYNKWPLRLFALLSKDGADFNETMVFRGTATSLETTDVYIRVQDSIRPTAAGKPQFESVVSLRDVVDSGQLAFQLRSNGKILSTAVMTCGIPFRPKYRQTGQILDIDEDHMYLFVKLVKIDRLRPQPDRDDVDSFVEVMYDGVVKNSTTVFSSTSPHYQSELVFTVGVDDVNHVTAPELEAMGPIVIDVWGSADIGNQHLGWTEVHLAEILSSGLTTNGGTAALLQTRRYYDRRKRKEMSYQTRVLSTKKHLLLPRESGDHDGTSMLYLEVWTKPDLGDIQLKVPKTSSASTIASTPSLPQDLAVKIKPHLAAWTSAISSSTTNLEDAGCLAVDQRNRLLPYNFFVYPIPSFSYFTTPFECFNFVRSISYSDTDATHGGLEHWFSADFILKARRGTPIFHTLVLANLFLGIKLMAFVCLGTRHNDEPFSSVLTIELQKNKRSSSCIRLWDAATMTVYVLPSELTRSSASLEKLYENLTAAGPSTESPGDSFTPVSEEPESRGTSVVSDTEINPRRRVTHRRSSLLNVSLEEMQQMYGVARNATRDCPAGSHALRTRVIYVKSGHLPFKTVRVAFNHQNVYANLLTNHDQGLRFEFTDTSQWCPLFPHKLDIDPLFPRNFATSAPDISTTSRLSSMLYDEIIKGLQSLRFQMSTTATTSWMRQGSIVAFLEQGMSLLSSLERLDPESKEAQQYALEFEEWRVALLAHTPDYHKMRWVHVTFNHANPKLIVQHLWNCISFLKENDQTLRLSLGIYIAPMPCDLMLTYVTVVAVTNLRRIERRQLSLIHKLYEKDDIHAGLAAPLYPTT